jgi:hypothetical protein
MVSTSSYLLFFRSIFVLGSENSHVVQGRENMEVAARVGFCVWPRNVAQAETSAQVRCRGGFAGNLTTDNFSGRLRRVASRRRRRNCK